MNFLEKSVVKSVRMRLIGLIILSAALLYAATFFISDYRAVISGNPTFESSKVKDQAYLQAMRGVMSHYTADMEHSGYYEFTEKKSKSGRSLSNKQTAWYYLAKVNDAYFIIKTNVSEFGDAKDNVQLKAVLHDLSDMEIQDVDRSIYNKMLLDSDFKEIRDLIVPDVMLYADSQSNQTMLAYILLAAIVICLFVCIRLFMICTKPSRHAIIKFAQENFGDLDQLAATLEQEQQLGSASTLSGITIYKDYLIAQGKSRFEIFKIADLLWIYVEEKKKKIFYFITIRTIRNMVFFEQKRQRKFVVSRPEMDFIFDTLAQRRPELIVGYDKELLKMWKKNPEQLAALVANRQHSSE